ncbi:amidophosphoribosyltransferase [Candidatus Micrarchaeota archaeon]|nr:amidophosphoribosyltransferase [Candidatus Micrarchaeota archaeon]
MRCKKCVLESTERLQDSCGVVATIGKNAAEKTFMAMVGEQNRGQDSCGIITFDTETKLFYPKKGYGLVTEVFKKPGDYADLKGEYAVGHVRYPTVGSTGEPQPVETNHPMQGIVLAHNGNIANLAQLKAELRKHEFGFKTEIDAEVLLGKFVQELMRTYHDFEAITSLMNDVDGSYSVVMINGKGKLYAFRDPLGIKPLVYGEKNGTFMVASESSALQTAGINLLGDIPPGAVLVADKEGYNIKQLIEAQLNTCVFEHIYFANPQSVIDGIEVGSFRKRLGKILGARIKIEADVVMPVPFSSNPTAQGFAKSSEIPYKEGLIKNQYVGRIFIKKNDEEREMGVRLKYNIAKSVVDKKRVVVVDDSIVRGTTMKYIVKLLYEAGAKEVHVIIAMPMIIGPCFYGVNITSYTELVAHQKTAEQINHEIIQADSLHFSDISDLYEAGRTKDFCVSCLTDEYLTKEGQRLSQILKENGGKMERRPWDE